MIISAWWLLTCKKLSGQDFEEIHWDIGSLEINKQVQIPPNTKYLSNEKVCLLSN